MQVISCVPPDHWERQFGMTPEALIAAAGQTKWESALLEGWTHAALTFGTESWLVPLWNRWGEPAEKGEVRQRSGQMYELLAPNLPHSLQEEIAIRLLRDPSAQLWSLALSSPHISGPALDSGAGRRVSAADYRRSWPIWIKNQAAPIPGSDTLTIAATALPVECLSEACEPLVVPDENRNWYIQQFQRRPRYLSKYCAIASEHRKGTSQVSKNTAPNPASGVASPMSASPAIEAIVRRHAEEQFQEEAG